MLSLLRQVKVRRLRRVRINTVCPKCQRERMPGEDSCARCGLLVARWEGFAADDPSHPALEEPWQVLQAAWHEDAAHTRFLELAASVEGLDVAAARYRRRQLAEPHDEKAARGLQRAVNMAQTLYQAKAAAERPPRAPVILKVVGTMFAGLILLAALYVVIVTFTRPVEQPGVPASAAPPSAAPPSAAPRPAAPAPARTQTPPTPPPSAPSPSPHRQTSSAPPPASSAPTR